MPRSPRLPRKLDLGWGYHVEIKLVTDREMADECDEEDRSEIPDGLWDVETRTIFIRRKLPWKRRLIVLLHERKHAVLDHEHWMADEFELQP